MRNRTLVALIVPIGLLAVACGSDDAPAVIESNSPSASDVPGIPASTPGASDPGTSVPATSDPATTDPATSDPASSSSVDVPSTSPVDGATIDWEPTDDDRVETGTLTVPIDYDDPSAGSFELFLARHLADPDERIGSLLVNPGGPGFGGSDFAIYATSVYSDDLTDHFDIVGWDPRGTGFSEPAIDCIDDYDRYFASNDITPDDDEERQQIVDLAEEFADACASENAEILQHIGTNDSARDMDAIRRALGEDEISYFGFSYGSELGAVWATLFPDTVRAAVLDGAADPNADSTESSLQQARGFEASLATFLAECSDDETCAFHHDGDAEGAFDALMESLDESPVPSDPGRPPVNLSVAISGVVEAMYDEGWWPTLAEALAAAEEGDGSGLLSLYDAYYQREFDGSYPDTLEAFQVISCIDDPERPTVEEEDALAPMFTDAAPRIAPGTTGSYFCTFFPPTESPRIDVTGAGAGPILVVGTTGDPATPLSSTETMAKTLEEGVLVVVEANQHTGYTVSECSTSVVDDYLIELDVPEFGYRCD